MASEEMTEKDQRELETWDEEKLKKEAKKKKVSFPQGVTPPKEFLFMAVKGKMKGFGRKSKSKEQLESSKKKKEKEEN